MEEKIMESVLNFSKERDLKKVERIVDCFRAKAGVKLLDYATDPDHNRCVVTVIGYSDKIGNAMVPARRGTRGVIPFIPTRNCTIQDADEVARKMAAENARWFARLFFLYENSATAPL